MLKKILYIFLEYKKQTFCMLLYMLIILILGFVLPFLSQNTVDKGLVEKNIVLLVKLCFATLLLNIIITWLNIHIEKNRLKIYNGLKLKLEKESFEKLLHIDMKYFRDKNIASIREVIREDVFVITSIISQDTVSIVNGLVMAIGGGIALFCINWKLGLLTLAFMPLNCLVTSALSKKHFKIAKQFIEKNRIYSEWFGDTINGIREIRLFNIQKNKIDEINEQQTELIEINQKQGILQEKNGQIQSLLLQVLSILIYLIAGVLLCNSNISIGTIIAFQTYALMLADPVVAGLEMIFNAAAVIPSIQRHSDFLNYKDEISGENIISDVGNITFEGVSFSYNEKKIFTDVNFSISVGESYAIIGKNGIGKTTMLKLILGILNPIDGRILMNGEDLKSYDINAYRNLFGVVSQDIYLFNISIKNNICLYRDIDDNELNRIVSTVHLTNLIKERGYDFVVGENGSMLSGGQKQKIALARALVLNKPFIVLDESTSNLDDETIEAVKEIISTKEKNKTVMCVTHSDDIINIFENKIIIDETVRVIRG